MENQIIDANQSISKKFENQPTQGNRNWTHSVKKHLGALGLELNYRVCAGGDNGFDSEWLYDLIWYRENDDEQLSEVPLILESEWAQSYGEIQYGFENLLVGKAKYKVMIFQAVGDEKELYFSKLKSAIEAYDAAPADETYLLSCFDENLWRFDVRAITG